MSAPRDEQITTVKEQLSIVEKSIANALTKVGGGEFIPAKEISDLYAQQATLKQQLRILEAAPAAGQDSESGSGENEIGIPRALRVTRHYTLSPDAIEQRRQASRKTRPDAAGNKNAWKHGKFAKDFIEGRIKPCLSTCPHYEDCELVSDGYTKPGGVCLDKAAVIATYSALMDAIKNKQHDDFNEVSALMISETMHVARMLLEDIIRDGGTVKREKQTKDGKTIEYVPHPGLQALPKLIADLGITPREMLATPKSIKDDKNDEEANKTAASLMSSLARRQRDRQERKGETGEDE